MYVKLQRDSRPFIANDGCQIQELLHPEKDAVDLPYSLALCRVAAHGSTYKHYLRQTEIYLVMEGAGLAHVGDAQVLLGPGDTVVIPPGVLQWIENTGASDLVFAAMCNPPWRAEDDVRV